MRRCQRFQGELIGHVCLFITIGQNKLTKTTVVEVN
jgi:hypothetical protein